MILGTYKFYQDERLLGKCSNLLTTEGKKMILRYLSQQTRQVAQAIAVGTGTTAANIADDSLLFEFARANIDVVSPDFTNNKVIFKATLPIGIQGNINEVGLWSQSDNVFSGNYGSRLLLSFDADTEAWSTGIFTSDITRIGGDSLRISALTSATSTTALDGSAIDVLGFNPTDKLKLAYINNDSNCSSIELRFKTDGSNYFKYTITNPTSGYHVYTFSKSTAVLTGTPSWDSIANVEIVVIAKSSGATAVDFDGLRAEDTQSLNPDYVLVSHAILGSPLYKNPAKQMDIEYSWDVTL